MTCSPEALAIIEAIVDALSWRHIAMLAPAIFVFRLVWLLADAFMDRIRRKQ